MTKTAALLLLCSTITIIPLTAGTDAESLYLTKCASCHGKHGEMKALNTSRPIADLTPAEIETALNGYKDGSYGGKLKSVKKGIVRSLDAAEISALSIYISQFGTKE